MNDLTIAPHSRPSARDYPAPREGIGDVTSLLQKQVGFILLDDRCHPGTAETLLGFQSVVHRNGFQIWIKK